tara:strand:- start:328 stop:549 length:222 start_codon:yes stop_codon:yes gene_type:complete
MVYYEEVSITGNAVWYFKKRKNGKSIRDTREVFSLKMDQCVTSENLEKLLEVLPDMFEGDLVEFNVQTKFSNC